MNVLVVTVVHDPRDARILHRQIAALLAAGHRVTFAAPFRDYGVEPPAGVRPVDLARARGRHRLTAARRARTVIRAEASAHDVVLVHDPELLLAVAGVRGPVVVWDVHEDTAAALTLKDWMPRYARRAAAAGVRTAESWAEGHVRLLLAEEGYRERFASEHPVVPNSTPSPDAVVPSGGTRVVYVGSLSRARGAHEMVELGRSLLADGIEVHLLGSADADTAPLLREAHDAGWVRWHGFVPNDEAMELVDGALAGLSLLHDEPNYRHSRPTKVIEYMAHGVAVVSTPTPPARDLVEATGCGILVPFGDVDAARDAVLRLRDDTDARQAMADRGRARALAEFDWRRDGDEFVAILERWVAESRTSHVVDDGRDS